MTDNVDAIKAYSKALKESDVATVTRLQSEYPSLPTTLTALGPWMCMAAKRPSVEILKLLVSAGADPDLLEKGSNRNALSCAANAGHMENVRYLHSIGGALDISSSTTNPLWGAIYARSMDTTMFLLANGMDTEKRYSGPNVKDMDALAFAWERGERDIANMIAVHRVGNDPAKVKALLDEADEIARLNNPGAA